MDGVNSEWQNTDDALFVGSKSQAQATLRCSADKDNLYFLVEVLDNNISVSDYATITLATPGSSSVGNGSVRIQVSPAGLKSQAVYKSSWFQEKLGIEAVPGIEGSAGNAQDTDKGWLCEIKVPKSSLPEQTDAAISLDFSLFDMLGGEDIVAPVAKPSQWPHLKGF